MTKREFIRGLEESLRGEVDRSVILDNVAYYETYIDEQVARGYTEEEVTAQLGSPNLIAKTIIDTGGGTGSYHAGNTEEFTEAYNRELRREYFRDSAEAVGMDYEDAASGIFIINGKRYDTGKWYVKALIAAVVILILLLVLFFLMIVLKGLYLAVKWLVVPVLVFSLISYVLKRLLEK